MGTVAPIENSADSAAVCRRCGAKRRTADGICVNCFLGEALAPDEGASAEEFERGLNEDEIGERPRRLGNYEIVRELGRGGMGAVYLARRADAQYDKEVAIKLIKRGMGTDAVLRHFRDERQILAAFDHPNIARLFDAGTSEEGAPYFVMEYVEGLPINKYCAAHGLSLNPRLKLFRDVCAAVSYAHRHLVVHRDLKPSNIIVTADGVPKLLDFGIAKMLQDGTEHQPFVTATGMRLMTPEYASPEQVRGEPVTTASDVYSLGVILYELVTGSSPYRVATHSSREIEQAITQQEPKRPSTVAALSKGRSELLKLLRADLDNIVLMALRKEPERRYRSVEQLSEDLWRCMESRPVLARRDTLAYRTSKFVRRNAVATFAAVLVLLSLISGMITTAWQAQKARAQEAIARSEKSLAERRFKDVRQLAHSVLFDYHDAIKDLPGATRVRERLVKDGLAYVDSLSREAAGDPALQRELAAAYERLGDVRGQHYSSASLGDSAGAIDSYEKALHIRNEISATATGDLENRRATAELHRKIGDVLVDSSEGDRGLGQLRQALQIFAKLAAEQGGDVEIRAGLSSVQSDLGLALEDRSQFAEALESHRKALAIRQELVAADSKNPGNRRGLSVSYENIGRILALTGKIKDALENNAKAMALRKALFEEYPTNADYRRILAISYQNTGDYLALAKDNAGAVENFRKKLLLDEQSYTSDPANAQAREDLAYSCHRLGELLADLGDYAAAATYDQRAIELTEQNMAPDPQDLTTPLRTATAYARLAEAQVRMGNQANARKHCEQAIAILRTTPADPGNVSHRSLRSHAYVKIADAYSAFAQMTGSSAADGQIARAWYRQALEILQNDHKRGLLNSDDEAEMQQVAAKLGAMREEGQRAK